MSKKNIESNVIICRKVRLYLAGPGPAAHDRSIHTSNGRRPALCPPVHSRALSPHQCCCCTCENLQPCSSQWSAIGHQLASAQGTRPETWGVVRKRNTHKQSTNKHINHTEKCKQAYRTLTTKTTTKKKNRHIHSRNTKTGQHVSNTRLQLWKDPITLFEIDRLPFVICAQEQRDYYQRKLLFC